MQVYRKRYGVDSKGVSGVLRAEARNSFSFNVFRLALGSILRLSSGYCINPFGKKTVAA